MPRLRSFAGARYCSLAVFNPPPRAAARIDVRYSDYQLNNPNRFNFDMALFMNFPIHESVSMRFRAEGFNIFNHTHGQGECHRLAITEQFAGDPSACNGFCNPTGASAPGRIFPCSIGNCSNDHGRVKGRCRNRSAFNFAHHFQRSLGAPTHWRPFPPTPVFVAQPFRPRRDCRHTSTLQL